MKTTKNNSNKNIVEKQSINIKPAYDFSTINLDTSKVSKIVEYDTIINGKKVTVKHTFY